MPSLYESTANTGEVASSNFTTLYNASGLQVPNAGAGQITGNLNVGGNLTVQGSTLLVGEVTLQNTLSLPNYTFPLPDGTTDQVMTTDGNGNLTWVDVTAIPGADYNISATTATGGANITLANTAGFTDSVKLAAGSNMNIVRTDANTITISTVADNIPDGTADGQMLVWENSAWTATNDVVWTDTTQRTAITGKAGITGRVNSAVRLTNNTGATPYATNDGTGLLYSVDSDSQAVNSYAAATAAYNSTNNHQFRFSTSKSSFSADTVTSITGGNTLVFSAPHGWSAGQNYTFVSATANGLTNGTSYYVLASGLTTTQAQVSLTSGGSPVALTNGTGLNLVFQDSERIITADQNIFTVAATTLTLNGLGTGVAGVNATIAVERGTSGTDATIVWNESVTEWILNNPLTTTAEYITINRDSTANNSYLNFNGSGKAIYWDNTNSRIATTDKLYVNGNIEGSSIISVAGESISMNNDSTGTDSYLNFKGFTQYLKWDNTNQRFQLSDKLYISTDAIPPALFERRVVSSDVSPGEGKSALRIFERVTDAPNNDNNIGGPAMLFGRSYGTSGGAERLFASIAGIWHGATTTADIQLNWSDDNFTETSPGVFPGSYTLLRLGSNNAEFFNDSLYVDYSTLGSTKVGINNTAPAYTLDVTGDARVTGDVITGGITAGNITVGKVTDNTISTTTGDLTVRTATGSTVELLADLSSGATGPVRSTRTTANTTGQIRALTLRTDSTGTPAVGLTTQLDFEVETAAGTFTRGGYIEVESTAITPGAEDFKMNFGLNGPTSLEITRASLDSSGNFSINGDLTVTGNDIKSSTGLTAITLDNNSVVVQGDITVNGQEIKSNGGTTVITLGGNNATFAGDIEVQGQEIKSNGGTTAITLSGADIATGDITLNGGDIRSSGGTVAISVSGANATVAGDLAVNGGDITTTQTTASVFNTTATTLNVGGAATAVNIGATTGRTIINNDLSIFPTSTNTLTVIGSISTLVTGQLNTTSTATATLVSTTRNTMNGSVSIKDNVTNALHTVNFTALRNGATAMLTTYGELYTAAALATFTVDISGSDMRLLVTPASANSTTFNAVRTAIS